MSPLSHVERTHSTFRRGFFFRSLTVEFGQINAVSLSTRSEINVTTGVQDLSLQLALFRASKI